MKLRIEPRQLPRYQTIAMVVVVLLSTIVGAGFFVFKSYLENRDRLSSLHSEAVQQQRLRLRTEVDSVIQHIALLRREARGNVRSAIREKVDLAWSVADSLYQNSRGQMSTAEMQGMVREALRNARFFDGRGYIFIDELAGHSILSPITPELEGTLTIDIRDDNGAMVVRNLIEASANSQNAGYASYRWYPPGESVMQEKISYVRRFLPWGWMIGAGDYLYKVDEDLRAQVRRQLSQKKIGEHGYFSVLSSQGVVLSAPATPELNGKRLRDIEDVDQHGFVEHILKVAARGGGFTEYQPPGMTGEGEKILALVQMVPGWDWVLVASIYPEDIRLLIESLSESLDSSLTDNGWFLVGAAAMGAGITLAVALLFSGWLKSGFRDYQRDIDHQQRQLEMAARVFEAAREGIMISGPDNRIVAVNEAFCSITGYSREETLGQNPSFLSSGAQGQAFYDEMWEQLRLNDSWQGEIWNRRKDQSLFPEWLSISVCRDGQGRILNYIATIADLSERKRTEERLRYLAEYDPLTDLPNRFLLADRVNHAVIQAKRYGGQLALLYMDLDRFKDVNDSLGHSAGDQVLREIGRRLVSLIRASDTVARLGGDEFAILMTSPVAPEAIAALAKRLIEGVVQPLSADAGGLAITPSVGIAVAPGDGDDFETLLSNADTALYHAKASGRNNFQFFTEQMNRRVSERLQLEADLRKAITASEFELYYQPQYSFGDQYPQGCEALIRWNHPERGIVSPLQFIPLAEENGLIVQIGSWVIQEACRQGGEWLAKGFGPISIAVNVSASQFDQDLLGTIRDALQKGGLPASSLVVEVTESLLIDDVNRAEEILFELKQMGVQIALDDFGTGYSSLSYLKRFSLDKLKIDQAFTAGVPADPDDTALTSSIIDIARNLKLKTIAEGVETEAQRDFLIKAGCDQVQGFLYARPVPARELEVILKEATTGRKDKKEGLEVGY